MRAILPILVAALLASAQSAEAQPQDAPPNPGVPASVLPHCISRQPGRLALTADQLGRIDDLLRASPDSARRRAAVLDVLTTTQKMIYSDTAGIDAC
jgi:hypothetical protein